MNKFTTVGVVGGILLGISLAECLTTSLSSPGWPSVFVIGLIMIIVATLEGLDDD